MKKKTKQGPADVEAEIIQGAQPATSDDYRALLEAIENDYHTEQL